VGVTEALECGIERPRRGWHAGRILHANMAIAIANIV
jgi:hypothetical protein